MIKKVTITEETAESLWSLIEDGINGEDTVFLRRELKRFNPTDFAVRDARIPADVINGIVARVQEINDLSKSIDHGGPPCTRSDAEAVVDAYANLDTFLGKRFNVQRRDKRVKVPYGWRIGE